MPRPPTAKKWVDLIRIERANFPKKTAIAIRNVLKSYEHEYEEVAPEEKTVRKYIGEFDALPEEQKEQYRLVFWPSTFERAEHLLPWEAAPTVIELHQFRALVRRRHYRESGDDAIERSRPTLRLAMWFWRVSLAQPQASLKERHSLASLLDESEGHRSESAEDARWLAEQMLRGPKGHSLGEMRRRWKNRHLGSDTRPNGSD